MHVVPLLDRLLLRPSDDDDVDANEDSIGRLKVAVCRIARHTTVERNAGSKVGFVFYSRRSPKGISEGITKGITSMKPIKVITEVIP